MANVYALRFERIDNQVKIVINNAVVWDSGAIQQNPHLDMLVGLDPYLQPGNNPITVQLYNAPQPPGIANPCAVHYWIEINGVKAGETEYRGGEQPAGLVTEFHHQFRWPYSSTHGSATKPILGGIVSIEPSGNDSGAPKDVTFVAKAGFQGVDNEIHDVTLKLIIFNATLSETPGQASNTWRVKSGEQGEVNVPTSCTLQSLRPDSYIVVVSLVDVQVPSGLPTVIDSKSSVYTLRN